MASYDYKTPPESYDIRQKYQGKLTPRMCFSGLLNQGATCYLNSLLQTLFMCKDFRRELLSWELPPEMHTDVNVPYQLQLLFAKLQFGSKPAVETKGVTKSFRWTSSEHFQQHDVQELNRVLFEALQKYVDHLQGRDFLRQLFEGRLGDYIQCSRCKNLRERVDTYQDVNIPIKGERDLQGALRGFVAEERLEGDNAVFCERCSSNQDSQKGLHFKSLPPVLTIQLQRFGFDFETLRREKLYTNLRVPETIDISHLHPDAETFKMNDLRTMSLLAFCCKRTGHALPSDLLKHIHSYVNHCTYELLSVLAHRGTTGGGHYIAHIRDLDGVQTKAFEDLKASQQGEAKTSAFPSAPPPELAPRWYTFNDEFVTPTERVQLTECIDPEFWEHNYDELVPPTNRPAQEECFITIPCKGLDDPFAEAFPEASYIFVQGKCIVVKEILLDAPQGEADAERKRVVLLPGDVVYRLDDQQLHLPCDAAEAGLMVQKQAQLNELSHLQATLTVLRQYGADTLQSYYLDLRISKIKEKNGVRTSIPMVPIPPAIAPPAEGGAGTEQGASGSPGAEAEGDVQYSYLSTILCAREPTVKFGDFGSDVDPGVVPEGEHLGLYVVESAEFNVKAGDFVTHVDFTPVLFPEEWSDLMAVRGSHTVWLRRKHKTQPPPPPPPPPSPPSQKVTEAMECLVIDDPAEPSEGKLEPPPPPSSPTRGGGWEVQFTDDSMISFKGEDTPSFNIFDEDEAPAGGPNLPYGPPTKDAASGSSPWSAEKLQCDTDTSKRVWRSSRIPSNSCRMYPYMAVYRLRGFESDLATSRAQRLRRGQQAGAEGSPLPTEPTAPPAEISTTDSGGDAELAMVPPYMRAEVQRDRAEFDNLRKEYARVEHLVELKVFRRLKDASQRQTLGKVATAPPPEGVLQGSELEWVTFDGPRDTVWFATLRCAEVMGIIEEGSIEVSETPDGRRYSHAVHTPETLRLRYYVANQGVAGTTIYAKDVHTCTLSEADVFPCAAFVLEWIEPGAAESNFGHTAFHPVVEVDLRVSLAVYQREPVGISEGALHIAPPPRCLWFPRKGLLSVVVPGASSLQTLAEKISDTTGIPLAKLVVTKYGKAVLPVTPQDEAATPDPAEVQASLDGSARKSHAIFTDDLLYCESTDDAIGEEERELLRPYYAGGVVPSSINGVNEKALSETCWIAVKGHRPAGLEDDEAEGQCDSPSQGDVEGDDLPSVCFVAVHQTSTMAALHSHVAQVLGADPCAFTLREEKTHRRVLRGSRCVSDYAEDALQLVIWHQLGSAPSLAKIVRITDESSSPEGSVVIEVKARNALLEPPQLIVTLTEKADNTVADFKQTLVDNKLIRERFGFKTVEDVRLTRQDLLDSRSRLKALVRGSWMFNFPGATGRIAVVVDRRQPGESGKPQAVYLTAQQLHLDREGDDRLSEVREVVVPQVRISDLQASLKEAFELDRTVDTQCIHFTRVPKDIPPAAVRASHFDDMQHPYGGHIDLWRATMPRGPRDRRNVFDPPFSIVQEGHVVFRVNNDIATMEPLSAEEYGKSAKGASFLLPASEGAAPATASSEPAGDAAEPRRGRKAKAKAETEKPAPRASAKEAGVVIRTEWDATPTEEPLQVAVPADIGSEEPSAPTAPDSHELSDFPRSSGGGGGGGVPESVMQISWENDLDLSDIANESTKCCVCLCEYELGDVLSILPCQDVLHSACLGPWLETHRSCPVCLQPL